MFVDQYLGGYAPTQNGPVLARGDYQGGITQELGMRWDPGLRRPYFDKNGRPAVTINTGRTTLVKGQQVPIREHRLIRDVVNNMGIMSPVFNATTLRKEEWIQLDQVVLRASRYRLRAAQDLAAKNTYGGFNGMSKMILEHETMSDPGEAIVDMDGLTPGRTDTPLFQLQGLPLPITHCDFWYDSRRLAISRNTGTPLDTTMGEAAGRRIGETIEKTVIGCQTGPIYGGASTYAGGYSRTSQVQGYISFSARQTTSTFYLPTGQGRAAVANGWKPSDTLADVLAFIDLLKLSKFYGPYMIYTSNDWDKYLDNDYILTGGNVATQTLRQRLYDIGREDNVGEGELIAGVRRLDLLPASTLSALLGPGGENINSTYPFTMILVQMTPDVCRMVNGMDITTVQWESVGGMRLNFKVMCIQVPQLRADYYGNCGILHATASL